MRNLCCFVAMATLLAGCSSPPEPLPVEWDKPAVQMNTGLPRWEPDDVVIPSPVVTGHWSQHIARFDPGDMFAPEIWYAVAHSSRVVVSAPDSQRYFMAKAWLRDGGYKGVTEYRQQGRCFTCNTTEIFFYR